MRPVRRRRRPPASAGAGDDAALREGGEAPRAGAAAGPDPDGRLGHGRGRCHAVARRPPVARASSLTTARVLRRLSPPFCRSPPRNATSTPPHVSSGTQAGEMASALAWRQEVCRGAKCGAVFYICGSCYRGQAYCGDRCRAPAQRQQRRNANRRHQQSPEGRLDHRDHQRAYRARCRLRGVTDTPSTGRPRSATIAPPVRHPAIRPVCVVCGRVWDAPRTPRPPSRTPRTRFTRR